MATSALRAMLWRTAATGVTSRAASNFVSIGQAAGWRRRVGCPCSSGLRRLTSAVIRGPGRSMCGGSNGSCSSTSGDFVVPRAVARSATPVVPGRSTWWSDALATGPQHMRGYTTQSKLKTFGRPEEHPTKAPGALVEENLTNDVFASLFLTTQRPHTEQIHAEYRSVQGVIQEIFDRYGLAHEVTPAKGFNIVTDIQVFGGFDSFFAALKSTHRVLHNSFGVYRVVSQVRLGSDVTQEAPKAPQIQHHTTADLARAQFELESEVGAVGMSFVPGYKDAAAQFSAMEATEHRKQRLEMIRNGQVSLFGKPTEGLPAPFGVAEEVNPKVYGLSKFVDWATQIQDLHYTEDTLLSLSVITRKPTQGSVSVREELGAVYNILVTYGLDVCVTDCSTEIKGSWDSICRAIKQVHRTMHESGVELQVDLLKIVTRVDKKNLLLDNRAGNVKNEAESDTQKKHQALEKQNILDSIPIEDKRMIEDNKLEREILLAAKELAKLERDRDQLEAKYRSALSQRQRQRHDLMDDGETKSA